MRNTLELTEIARWRFVRWSSGGSRFDRNRAKRGVWREPGQESRRFIDPLASDTLTFDPG